MRFIPLDEPRTLRDQLRRGWLWLLGGVGLVTVACAVVVELRADVHTIWSDLLLTIGSGVLLFAVLFWAEKGLVQTIAVQNQRIVESLTGRAGELAHLADDPDMWSMPERASDKGQIGVARSFFVALSSGRYEEAWLLADADWRLCRVQAWLWNNRDAFGSDEAVLQRLADEISVDLTTEMSRNFVEVERRQFRELWEGIDAETYGGASRRRIVAPGYEVVLLVPLDGYPNGVLLHGETLVRDVVSVLVRWVDARWRVAAFGSEVAPRPGWPPSWWIQHDPAAIQWFREAGLAE